MAKRGDERTYHHGALKDALIAATDAILREQGIEGFTLREAARRAGVSQGAPAYHFGNSAGLLTEVALLAYVELGRYLAAAAGGDTPTAELRAIAYAYVTFALDHPGRFKLMFRKDLVDRTDERYRRISTETLSIFANAAARVYGGDLAEGNVGGIIAAWSTAHGIAELALEDKFEGALSGGGIARFRDVLLPEILKVQWPER